MSTLIVPVTTISKLRPHPNADKLDIAEVLGWQVVTGKDNFKEGDRIIYIPPDAVLPVELSDRLKVTQYLSKGRVRQVKLRGEPSFGFAVPLSEFAHEDIAPAIEEGSNYADFLGITKYEPPVRISQGDMAPDRDDFPKYSNVENMRNFPTVIQEGEKVMITEKIHGTNCRVGIINGELVAGSRGNCRKPPQSPDGEPLDFADQLYASNIYWSPFSIEPVRNMLKSLAEKHNQVVLYGEVFGSKIQDLDYGCKGTLGFRAFDLMLDGKFIDAMEFTNLCGEYGVLIAPTLEFDVPFSLEAVKRLSSGKTNLVDADHIREGVVVKPMIERTDPKIGRVILKYVNDEYLFGDHSDATDV